MIDEKKLISDLENAKSNCKHLYELIFFDAVMAIVDSQKQLNNRWIPTSERLPKETRDYVCTVEWYGTSTKKLLINNGYKIEKRIKIVHFLDSNKSFKECDGFCTYKVIAWKHEEPYKTD